MVGLALGVALRVADLDPTPEIGVDDSDDAGAIDGAWGALVGEAEP